jgi:hypothetical protein
LRVCRRLHDGLEQILYTEFVLLFSLSEDGGLTSTKRFAEMISPRASGLLRHAVIQIRLYVTWAREESSRRLAERAVWLREWVE